MLNYDFFYFSVLRLVAEEEGVIVEAEAFFSGNLVAEIGVGVEAPEPVKGTIRSVRVVVVIPVRWWRGRIGEGSVIVVMGTRCYSFVGVVSSEEAANDGEENEYEV